MNTEEHFNTSTNVSIIVLDGDDQYPQFLPCKLLFEDETRHICTSPVYTVNVTEGEEVTARYTSVTVTLIKLRTRTELFNNIKSSLIHI